MAATPYYVTVNIYAEDGTVAIAHGGVEMGQGINTKACNSLIVLSHCNTLPLESLNFHHAHKKFLRDFCKFDLIVLSYGNELLV